MASNVPFHIPPDFDPEQHLVRPSSMLALPDLRDGVTVYETEAIEGVVNVFRVRKPEYPGAGSDRMQCFECHTRPNGDVDCYVVRCPPPVVLHD